MILALNIVKSGRSSAGGDGGRGGEIDAAEDDEEDGECLDSMSASGRFIILPYESCRRMCFRVLFLVRDRERDLPSLPGELP